MLELAFRAVVFHGTVFFIFILSFNINPAVTFGVLVGGRISLVRALFYWVVQILGAIVASHLIRITTGGMVVCLNSITTGVCVDNALIFEIVLTFRFMYTIFATIVDPERGHLGIIVPNSDHHQFYTHRKYHRRWPPFDGAPMNLAMTFGPSLIGWRWKNHWIYWVGSFIGAALVYEYLLIPAESGAPRTHQPLATEEYWQT